MRANIAIRRVFVWLHRWVGLLLAGFLIVVGLTGSLITFNSELERLVSPQLFAPSRPGFTHLDLGTLAARAESLAPEARVEGVSFTAPDQAVAQVVPRANPATGHPFALGFDQLFLNPWTGEELGRRMNGDLSQGLINLMPFIYDLHWRLALGTAGFWILGIMAVAWTIDCFVGFYLTLPVAIENFWERWKPAWLIKWRAGAFRLNVDLHRASGLWLWGMLFIFAWSSVMMDMRPVYDWVTQCLFDYRSPDEDFASASPHANESSRLDWTDAEITGRRLIQEQAALHDFTIEREIGLYFNQELGAYYLNVRSNHDFVSRGTATSVSFDAYTGAFKSLDLPSGQRTGNTITTWMYALHMANVFGLPYRIFVCALGILITMLSVTGVYIWWKKRRAQKFSKAHRGAMALAEVAE